MTREHSHRQASRVPDNPAWRSDVISLVMPALFSIPRRAEKRSRDAIRRTFVDIGTMSASLASGEHQIVYGRRGTGKTHALENLAGSLRERGHTVVTVDLRPIGFAGSHYLASADGIARSSQQAIIDLLEDIHQQLFTRSLELMECGVDVTTLVNHLDAFAKASCDVEIVGSYESTEETATTDRADDRMAMTLSATPSVAIEWGSASESTVISKRVQSGIPRFSLMFGPISRALKGIVDCLPDNSLCLILDEWNALPLSVQPLVADFLRRCVLPVDGLMVKIAAIHARSQFSYRSSDGYVGFELGADIMQDLDLDEYMAWNGHDTRAEDFFRNLFCRHIAEHWRDEAGGRPPVVSAWHLNKAIPDFQYLVIAAGGVPRDAINVAAMAAQESGDQPIELRHIAAATRRWFLNDKESRIGTDHPIQRVLQSLRSYAEANRRRGFLLDRHHDARAPEIQDLYDSRIIHRIATGVGPGGRYDAFILDFGVYADKASSPGSLRMWRENWMSNWRDFDAAHSREVRQAVLTVEDLRRCVR